MKTLTRGKKLFTLFSGTERNISWFGQDSGLKKKGKNTKNF